MILHFFTAFFLLFATPEPQYSTANNGSILLTISNIRTNNGKVNVSLFNLADGFPSNVQKAVAVQSVAIQKNQATVRFENLPFGTYAIACLHDENGNGKMDTNLVGIPKEGYGASNNAVSKFSAPKFEAAKFPFNSAVLSVNCKMFYW
jgi:uncharacterized protein (DUF2141 family)